MLVSVIIPMYNREATIKDAARSVLSQTYKDLELIIVDDYSKDNSVAVVEKMASEDSRVRLIKSEKNGGACVARNIGIDNALGEVIAFQDSDDIWHKDKLEKSLKAMEEQGADFVFSALRREETKGGKKVYDVLPSYDLNKERDKLARIIFQNCVSTQTIVARKRVFEECKFDKAFPRFQDWDFTIQVINNNHKIYYIDEPLVDCYVLGDSITSDGSKAIKAVELLEEKYKELYERYPMSYKTFCQRSGYLVEMSGGNGATYFKKAYKSGKGIGDFVKFVLAKLRLYRPLNRLVSKLM